MMDLLTFLDQLKQDKKKLILAAIVALAIVLIDVSLVMKAQVSSIGSLGKKVIKLKKDIEGVKKDMTLMRKNEQQKETAEVLKIYTVNEIPLLLQDISSLANENQIDVLQISQSREVKKQEEVKNKKAKGKSAKPEQSTDAYVSVAIKLDLAGTFHSLGTFLNQLERAEQPLFAQEFRIMRDSSNYMKQNVSLTLRTNVKK